MKSLLIIIIFISLCSCNGNRNKQDSISLIPNLTANNMEIKSDWKPENIINHLRIKKLFENNYTSGIISNIREEIYLKPNYNGYYGGYNFLSIQKSDNCFLSAHMVIYNNEEPWTYNNITDQFIEITVYNPGIPIFDKIEIGKDLEVLYQTLGKPEKQMNDFIIYKNDSLNAICIFKIVKGKIKAFRLGYYKKEILSNLNLYMDKLIDQIIDCDAI